MEVKRWESWHGEEIASPKEVEQFLDRYEALCRESGFCFGHEDGHGAFLIHAFSEDFIKWARDAHLCK